MNQPPNSLRPVARSTAENGSQQPSQWSAALQLAAVLGLLWLTLFEGQQLIFGAAAVVVVVAVSRHLFPLQPLQISPQGLARFVGHFLMQSLAGALDVAMRALHPRRTLDVGKWRYPIRLPPGQARFLFIGCIGLIPGSVGQALTGDELTVHSISGDPQQGLAALEQRVAALYGLTLDREDT